jgi:hypothetical protein
MNIASQPIEQPTLPPMGNADSLAGVGTAKSTPVTVTQVKKLADLTSVELDGYIKDKAIRCQRHVAGFARRSAELYLGLYEMEGRFNKQQGARTDLNELTAKTWTEYVEGSGANYDAYRKWKSRMNESMKLLGGMVSPDSASNGKGGKGGASHKKVSPTVAEAANNLAEVKKKLGSAADSENEQAKAIIGQYEKAYADAVAKAGESGSPAKEKPLAETRINKRLVSIVEAGERYIRVMERVVNSKTITLTDRQRKDIQKASEPWRKVLRDARELCWAVKVMEKQVETAEQQEEEKAA